MSDGEMSKAELIVMVIFPISAFFLFIIVAVVVGG